ncbi:hypothetical protein B0H12DRAFT_1160116 [Mycena haematopus]|nr:hypothetical protein B0H12DRAFT_1160116 [Mycena haematopus]
MCLPLVSFSHRCWQYRPHYEAIFPGGELRMSLEDYRRLFLLSVQDAPRIISKYISSVAYCRTRGAGNYPFLIVHLDDPLIADFPVRMKLAGFDGVRASTLTVAHVRQSVRSLVGTKHFDVLHTSTFRWTVSKTGMIEPSIVDLLALAQLATEWDNSREEYPAALFLALNTLFNATASPSSSPPPRPAADIKSAILDVFPARRQRLQNDIDLRRLDDRSAIRTNELRAENARLVAQVAHLQGTVERLTGSRGIDSLDATVVE